MIQIAVLDREGSVIAEACSPAVQPEEGGPARTEQAMLCVDREWQEGDRIRIESDPAGLPSGLTGAPAGAGGHPAHLMVRMDAALPEGEVYLPEGIMDWPVPMGERRLAYAPGAFGGPRHIVTAREMTAAELSALRDVARNPADLRGDTNFYPHCTANVETRNESVFAARNVIDGLRFNTYHGEWPFESWGIGAREDAWCKIDFGREITAEKMALTLRADFPHDAYWVSGHAADSNGDEIAFSLRKTGERQWIDLGGRRVRWLRLERMQKSDDPSAFPSLRAWEVFGR